jgi:biopolymer transport protein ExbD
MAKAKTLSVAAPQTGGVTKPQLTSLIDVMTILLVFLLKSFSVEGTLVRPSDDLALPEANTTQRPVPALNVEITTNGINVDGRPVAGMDRIVQSDSLMIPELYQWLTSLSQLTGTAEQDNEVIIQCDRYLDFKYVKKVMFTCSKARYSDFSLLVLEKE